MKACCQKLPEPRSLKSNQRLRLQVTWKKVNYLLFDLVAVEMVTKADPTRGDQFPGSGNDPIKDAYRRFSTTSPKTTQQNTTPPPVA
jgi:hypothetical protein